MKLGTLLSFFVIMLPCVFGIVVSLRFLTMPVMSEEARQMVTEYARAHDVVVYAPNIFDRFFDWGGLLVTSSLCFVMTLAGLLSMMKQERRASTKTPETPT